MSYDMAAKNSTRGISEQPCMPYRQTLRERLMQQKTEIERHLENLNAALKFMDDNPNFEAFHDTITKAGF